MNAYTILALALLIGGLGPVLAMGAVGRSFNRLIALEMGSSLGAMFMLIFIQVSNQSSELILPLMLVPLSVAGTLVFTRLLPGTDIVMAHDVAISFVGLGVAVAIASAVGALAVGTDSYNRLHFVTSITSVAGPLVAVGLYIQSGWGITAGTIILIVGLLFVGGPVTSAATGRMMAQADGTVDSEAPE